MPKLSPIYIVGLIPNQEQRLPNTFVRNRVNFPATATAGSLAQLQLLHRQQELRRRGSCRRRKEEIYWILPAAPGGNHASTWEVMFICTKKSPRELQRDPPRENYSGITHLWRVLLFFQIVARNFRGTSRKHEGFSLEKATVRRWIQDLGHGWGWVTNCQNILQLLKSAWCGQHPSGKFFTGCGSHFCCLQCWVEKTKNWENVQPAMSLWTLLFAPEVSRSKFVDHGPAKTNPGSEIYSCSHI